MRRLTSSVLCVAVAASSCAAAIHETAALHVLPDNTSQDLFNDAIRWSRANHLETGGCFSVFSVQGDKVFVTDAVERVIWRRDIRVTLDCPPHAGLWHTHWAKAKPGVRVQCNMDDALDRWMGDYSHAALLVICGEGRDSVILYASAPPDSLMEFRRRHPPSWGPPDTDTYDCAHESPASLARPWINCAER